MRDPGHWDILVQPDALRRRVEELGAQITATTRAATSSSSGCSRARSSSWPTSCGTSTSLRPRLHGGLELRLGHGLERGRADPQGPRRAAQGRDVLIVEDIVDSGLTLQYLLRNLGARNPASLEVCALLTKPARRKVELDARYVGFEIPDRFVIGYGLDFDEKYRNLPYVATMTDEAVAAARRPHR
jgi:hypoxanthine phosphoribosyltransferase